jgi:Site-specific recombinase XerD
MKQGMIFKRCGCRDGSGRRLERSCPRLRERGHGSWYFQCSARNLLGVPERARRGGFASRAAAMRARDEWLAATTQERTARSWTVAQWLRYWLSTRTSIRATTRLHYTGDVQRFLIPHLGEIRLSDLDARRLRAAFAEIAATTNSKGVPQSASCLHHLRNTLRAALNLAVREGVLANNPVRGLELPSYRRPLARVWTDNRVAHWQHTGERPAVAVWTAAQLAAFLTAVADDSLYAMWWLMGLRGLRRGEACGLRWSDLDLEHGVLYVTRNRTTAGYQVIEGDPKTEAGIRAVALDRRTVAVLRSHRAAQQAARARRLAAGTVWVDSGYVFVRKDGSPIHPSYASTRFRLLIARTGMPPIRLHDLRHVAFTLAHEAGADLKDVQDQAGHASCVWTADVYMSVTPAVQHRNAENTAKLVLAAARRTGQKIQANARGNRPPVKPATGTPTRNRPVGGTIPQASAPQADHDQASRTKPQRPPRGPHRPQRTKRRNRRR